MYFTIILGATILFSPVLRKCNGDDFSKMHPKQIFKDLGELYGDIF